MRKHIYIKHIFYLIALVFIDQTSKTFAKLYLKNKQAITLIPNTLKLQYHENDGALWGILSGKIIFLTIITIIILLAIIYLYINIPNEKKLVPLRIILIFIASGAIGNLYDRIAYKYVIDFIYFELINFPIFNFADIYVSLSSITLLFLSLFYYDDKDFNFIDNLFKIRKNK